MKRIRFIMQTMAGKIVMTVVTSQETAIILNVTMETHTLWTMLMMESGTVKMVKMKAKAAEAMDHSQTVTKVMMENLQFVTKQ